MRIVIFSVKYSPNLGDGLLSECLEAELTRQNPDIAIRSVDLAGRAHYATPNRHRRILMAILMRLPGPLRRLLAGIALNRLVAAKLAPMSRAALADADAAIVGGGNLLADADLNFPLKIGCALDAAAAAGKPVAVFGVGVSDNWSARGRALFANALKNVTLSHAAVRDRLSREIWERNLRGFGIRTPVICRDPGLLAARHFEASPVGTTPAIGLCLTNPVALRYHGATVTPRALNERLVAIAQLLVERGHLITLFTNGSPEDREYLTQIAPRFKAVCGKNVGIAPAFEHPADLARFLSSCSAILAHRMHACIGAFAYRIPHVGFAWDRKMESFFESVGRSEFLVDPALRKAEDVVALTERAIALGIPADRHEAIVSEASEQVAALIEALEKGVAG